MMSTRIKKLLVATACFASALLVGTASVAAKGHALPPASQSFAGCEQHFPAMHPLSIRAVDPTWRPYALCASGFAVMYSGLTKNPMVVVERINAQSVGKAQSQQRTNDFLADDRIAPGERAELSDYLRSGFARGHMAAAANMPARAAMSESFLLTNIVPQNFEHNAEVWSKVESATRRFAKRAEGDVFVFTGPLFLGPVRTIGRNRVWVPTHIFKLVQDSSSGRAWAFIHANSSEQRMEAPVSYQEFVARTGWDLLAQTHKGAPL